LAGRLEGTGEKSYRSLEKTFNLLVSTNNFPKGMIVDFSGKQEIVQEENKDG
jgi:hypothetical protein